MTQKDCDGVRGEEARPMTRRELIDLKLEPAHGQLMRAHRGVSAGYHMNKVHWNTVAVNNTDVERGELLALIDESDSLTRPALHHVKAPRSAQ